MPNPPPNRIAVLGGGISGLAAAHRVRELHPTAQVTLFEAADRVGGVLQTIHRDGFLIERSADNFITNTPWAIGLCRRIGFEDQLIPNTANDRRAFIVHRGQLQEVPAGFALMAPARIWPMLTTPLLSPTGKLRLISEYFRPGRKTPPDYDESLASFVRRRLGTEVFDRLVQPLIGGIYTADPEKLSLAATMPRFLEMERTHGGLIRGSRLRGPGIRRKATPKPAARYNLFVAPREGMSSLVAALAERIGRENIRLNSPVERLEASADQGWRVFLQAKETPQSFDALIVALPATKSSKLLQTVQAELAQELSLIPHASSAVVCLAYNADQFVRPLAGFGFVVPRVENRRILSVSYASRKYAGRAPDGKVLLRVFVGGALQPEMAAKSDAELLQITQQELAELLGVSGEPLFHEIARLRDTMPQFHLGHLERVRRIGELAAGLTNFALAGNVFQGVGIPHCVHSGEQAAERIVGKSPQADIANPAQAAKA